MKQKLALLSLVPMLMGMVACQKDDDLQTGTEEDSYSHTSLAYMVADNSLDSYSEGDIEEMLEGFESIDDTANFHLLVYLDGSSNPKLMRITKEDGTATSETIKTYEEQNSLDPEIMASVINEALGLYPADSYGLTLWSHGSGWLPGTDQSGGTTTKAFGVDDDNNTMDQDEGTQMDILDLKTALLDCPYFRYILFDACDMQGIEVAYELKDCAAYFIASPTEVPAYGAPYDEVTPAFFTEDNTAKAIALAYYGPYEETYSYDGSSSPLRSTNTGGPGYYDGGTDQSTGYRYGIAISVVDASKLEELAAATKSIISSYISDGATISTNGIYSYDDNYYNFYYDLDGFIQGLTGNDDNYTSWKEIFDGAVPYFYTTGYTYNSYAEDGSGGMVSMEDASGLSTFIPNNSNF